MKATELTLDGGSTEQIAQDKADEVFRKITGGEHIQGIWAEDGYWYINAQVAKISDLVADLITAGKLRSVDTRTYFDLDEGVFVCQSDTGTVKIGNGNLIAEDGSGNTRVRIRGVVETDEGEQYSIGLYGASGALLFELLTLDGGRLRLTAPLKDASGNMTTMMANVGWRHDDTLGYYLGVVS